MPKQVRRRPSGKSPAKGEPILQASDVRTLLLEQATQLAPADVSGLMAEEQNLRARVAALPSPQLSLLREQLNLAIDCLCDHVAGTCPQIPYFTISLLAAAVLYFADELDVIPDFLPRVGRLDDAAVMAMACQVAEPGLRRYCEATGRSTAVIRAVHAPSRRRPARK